MKKGAAEKGRNLVHEGVFSTGRAKSENLQGEIPRRQPFRANSNLLKTASVLNEEDPAKLESRVALASTTLPKDWENIRSRIMRRDKKVCAFCGERGQLTTHHVDGNEGNNRPANLVTVCRECHNRFPVPPFSERFYCKTIIHNEKSVCLRIGVRGGNLTPDNCRMFSPRHGCLLAPTLILQGAR